MSVSPKQTGTALQAAGLQMEELRDALSVFEGAEDKTLRLDAGSRILQLVTMLHTSMAVLSDRASRVGADAAVYGPSTRARAESLLQEWEKVKPVAEAAASVASKEQDAVRRANVEAARASEKEDLERLAAQEAERQHAAESALDASLEYKSAQEERDREISDATRRCNDNGNSLQAIDSESKRQADAAINRAKERRETGAKGGFAGFNNDGNVVRLSQKLEPEQEDSADPTLQKQQLDVESQGEDMNFVRVKTIQGMEFKVSLRTGIKEGGATAADLKDCIASSQGFLRSAQRLIFCGRVLRDEVCLASAGVSSGKIVHLVVSPARRVAPPASPPKPSSAPASPTAVVASGTAAGTTAAVDAACSIVPRLPTLLPSVVGVQGGFSRISDALQEGATWIQVAAGIYKESLQLCKGQLVEAFPGHDVVIQSPSPDVCALYVADQMARVRGIRFVQNSSDEAAPSSENNVLRQQGVGGSITVQHNAQQGSTQVRNISVWSHPREGPGLTPWPGGMVPVCVCVSGGTLIMEDCKISADRGVGVAVLDAGMLDISGSEVSKCGHAGIMVKGDGTVSVIDSCTVFGNFGAAVHATDRADLTVKRSVVRDGEYTGVQFDNYAVGVVRQSEFTRNSKTQILILAARATLEANHIHEGHYTGVHAAAGAVVRMVSNNVHFNAASGVDLCDGAEVECVGNSFHDGRHHGIMVHQKGCGLISRNSVVNNAHTAVGVLLNSRARVHENLVTDGRGNGIAVAEGATAILTRNTVKGHETTPNIVITSASSASLQQNICEGGAGGISVESSQVVMEGGSVLASKGPGVLVVGKSRCAILDMHVKNGASAGFGLSSSTVTIKDSSAEQCSGFGLGVRNGGVATVSNMQVTDCRDIGVYVSEGRLTGDAVSVSQSKRCGIAVAKGGEAVLSSCSSSGNADAGLFVFDGGNCVLQNSVVRENIGPGVGVKGSGSSCAIKKSSLEEVILHSRGVFCRFEQWQGRECGVLAYESGRVTLSGTTVEKNKGEQIMCHSGGSTWWED